MATIQKESRRRKGPDMGMLMGLMQQYGPDADRRRQMDELQMEFMRTQMINRNQLGTQEAALHPGVVAGQQQGLAQGTQQTRGMELGNQATEATLPFAAPAAAAGVTGQNVNIAQILQQMGMVGQQHEAVAPYMGPMAQEGLTAAELQNDRTFFDNDVRAQTVPLDVNKAAIENVRGGAEAAYAAELPALKKQELDQQRMSMLVELAKNDPRILAMIDPAALATQSGGLMRAPQAPPPLSSWREDFLSKVQSDPVAAYDMYMSGPDNYKAAIPMTPEQQLGLVSGAPDEDFLRSQGVLPPEPQGLFGAAMDSFGAARSAGENVILSKLDKAADGRPLGALTMAPDVMKTAGQAFLDSFRTKAKASVQARVAAMRQRSQQPQR